MTFITSVPETIPDVFIGQGTLGQNQVVFDTEKFGYLQAENGFKLINYKVWFGLNL